VKENPNSSLTERQEVEENMKKITLGIVATALVAGLLFGGRLIPYSVTAFNKIQAAANDSVPVAFQLDAAKEQLKAIGPEIKNMVHQVAKEKSQINKLAADLSRQHQSLKVSYDEMQALRQHLESGDEFYVAVNHQRFNQSRVEEDLRHRLSVYKTAKATVSKKEAITKIRTESLANALAKLDEAKSQQRELEVKIENLTARHRMNEVIATANEINIDNSQLAKARKMLSDLDATIAAEEEFLNILPKYRGQIPVSADSVMPATNVLEEMDAYFKAESGKPTQGDSLDREDLVSTDFSDDQV